ncbi:MAG TPA: glycosyltransferase, partial [Candidatus Dormibacteraeota bacterium]|nr:glycosyltransferase [Candidatus Dormibacteraeota bacterium]
HTADRIVVMVPEHAEQLRQQFRLPPEKLAVVRNGFFEEDFASLESLPRRSLDAGFVHLGHFGTVYPGNQGLFFEALADLLNQRPWLGKRLRLHIVGAASEQVLREVQQDGLREITEIHGFLPHVETLQMMRACHCLLLFWGRRDFSRLAVAGKTYEYLRIGRPILAVTSEGGVKQLVQAEQAGWVVPPDDIGAIQDALLRAMEMEGHANTAPVRPSKFVAQFRWDHQAKILAETFDEALTYGR